MKKMVLIAMATMILVGCGSEPVKQTPLSPEGEETIIEENVIEENVIKEIEVKEIEVKEIETWDGPNVKRWD